MARRNSALLRTLVLASAVVFLGPVMLHAQDVTLTGTVTDATKLVLPGVTVTAVNVDSGNTFTGVTDASGAYVINAIRAGTYKLTVALPGFSTQRRDNLELQVSQRAVLNFSLAISSLEETVTVQGSSPLVDFTRSQVAGVIDQKQIRELPLNGRNWMELALLAPGNRV